VKLIRLPEVLERVALKKTAVYKLISEDEFPKPVKIGSSSAWVEHEITEWILARASARPATRTMQSSA
jgi:prophage regulatory protein